MSMYTRYGGEGIIVLLFLLCMLAPLTLGAQSIHSAALAQNYDALLGALEAGESPDSYNLSGFAPLHSAARAGNLQIAALLLDNGADINIETNTAARDTPLHLAVINGRLAMVQLLLERGAEPNFQNQWGNTPLHEAARFAGPATVRALVRLGADRDIVNSNGQTFGDIAAARRKEGTPFLLPEPQGAGYAAVGVAVPISLSSAFNVVGAEVGVALSVGGVLEFASWLLLGGGLDIDLVISPTPLIFVARPAIRLFPIPVLGYRLGPVLFGLYGEIGGSIADTLAIGIYYGGGIEVVIDVRESSAIYARGGIANSFAAPSAPIEIGWLWWF